MDINEIATKQDVKIIIGVIAQLNDKLSLLIEVDANKVYSIHELSKMKTVGGYDKIKTLIRKEQLQTTPDGKITQRSLNEYLQWKHGNKQ